MEKLLNGREHICFYCGREKKEEVDYRERETYYECDCPDVRLKEKLERQIKNLQSQIPQPKFKVITQSILKKI